jgi:signal peptidase I
VSRRRPERPFRKTASLTVAGVLGLLALRIWVVEPVTVSSDSMEPTVAAGETVVLSKVGPQPGDRLVGRIVALRDPRGHGITLKRVAAEGAQSLAIRDGVLFVEGAEVEEPYVDRGSIDGTFFHRVTVPAGHVFVLGDNRDRSVDSRDFGFVALDDIIATVLWTY